MFQGGRLAGTPLLIGIDFCCQRFHGHPSRLFTNPDTKAINIAKPTPASAAGPDATCMHARGPPSTMALQNQSRVGFLTDEYHGRDATFRQKLDMRRIKENEIEELKETIRSLQVSWLGTREELTSKIRENEEAMKMLENQRLRILDQGAVIEQLIFENDENIQRLVNEHELRRQETENAERLLQENQQLINNEVQMNNEFRTRLRDLENAAQEREGDAYQRGLEAGQFQQMQELEMRNQALQAETADLLRQKEMADARVQLLAEALAALHESDMRNFNALMQQLQQMTSQLNMQRQPAATAVRTPIAVASMHIV